MKQKAEKVFGGAYAKGVCLVACASVFWGVVCFSRKLVLPYISPIMLTALASAATVLTLLAIFRPTAKELLGTLKNYPKESAASMLFGTAAMVAFFFGFDKLDIGVANVVGRIQPILVVVLAKIVLGERFPISKAPLVLLCLLSSYLIVVPDPWSLSLAGTATEGVLWLSAGGCFMALCSVISKHLVREKVPPHHITLIRYSLAAVFAIPLLFTHEALGINFEYNQTAMLLVLGAGAISAMSFVFYLKGLETVPVSVSTFVEMITPVVTIGLGVWALGEVLTPSQMASIPFLMASVWGIQRV